MTSDPSNELKARAARVMPGGVSSNIRRAEGPDAILVRRAEGARVWDEADREYPRLCRGPLDAGHAAAHQRLLL
jgi:glutamate-1-semialdehyde aminotransferase